LLGQSPTARSHAKPHPHCLRLG